MPKAGEVDRKWYVLDAAGKPLGRVATKAAHLLRGKHKPTFAPHVDCGDNVIIINCDKAVLTGNKLEKKFSPAGAVPFAAAALGTAGAFARGAGLFSFV